MTTTPGAAAHSHGNGETAPKTYGLLAEFDNPDALIAATKKAKAEGFSHMDTHTPYPVGETADALGFPKSEMAVVMFIGGLVGACGGFFMEYWTNGFGYPLIVGGRPYFSWPSFIPITFELMVLTAALSGLFGLIGICGLPRLNHPLFNSKTFDRASRDRFFLCVEASDPKFDLAQTTAFLRTLHPLSVEEVME
ncbi:MAG TPA: DUF3341 domain-containing protein [Gemmataceae bacterium]|nr:DUF3341 domain-containing protein [Gemmataceae bacterium]